MRNQSLLPAGIESALLRGRIVAGGSNCKFKSD